MKLYAEQVFSDFLKELGLLKKTTFGLSELELNEKKQNYNFKDSRIYINILGGEYENEYKDPILSSNGVFQKNIGIIDFEIRVLIIGLSKVTVDNDENKIIKHTNRYFTIGGFPSSIIQVLRVRYEDEDEEITPKVSVVNMEAKLRLPVYFTENLNIVEGNKLNIDIEKEAICQK